MPPDASIDVRPTSCRSALGGSIVNRCGLGESPDEAHDGFFVGDRTDRDRWLDAFGWKVRRLEAHGNAWVQVGVSGQELVPALVVGWVGDDDDVGVRGQGTGFAGEGGTLPGTVGRAWAGEYL